MGRELQLLHARDFAISGRKRGNPLKIKDSWLSPTFFFSSYFTITWTKAKTCANRKSIKDEHKSEGIHWPCVIPDSFPYYWWCVGRTRRLGGATVGFPLFRASASSTQQQQIGCWYSESIPHVLSVSVAATGFEWATAQQNSAIQMRNYLERRTRNGLLCELDADVVIACF